jgi:hypothetical protein
MTGVAVEKLPPGYTNCEVNESDDNLPENGVASNSPLHIRAQADFVLTSDGA